VLLDSPVTLLLMAINVLVGFHSLFVDPSTVGRLAFRPALVRRGEWWRFFTAGFAHVGGAHLLFNMVTLFFFGPVIEQILGPIGYLVVYVGSDLAANALTYWRHRNNPSYSAVGASGAVSGVLFSFCLFFPLEKIYIFFAIPMWAIVFAVVYIVGSVYAAGQGGGRVAHEAHIGGALGGLALTLLLFPEAIQIFLSQIGLG
jgi:membrane associated rhomboid family serine protease